jgi:hypothetical protein
MSDTNSTLNTSVGTTINAITSTPLLHHASNKLHPSWHGCYIPEMHRFFVTFAPFQSCAMRPTNSSLFD